MDDLHTQLSAVVGPNHVLNRQDAASRPGSGRYECLADWLVRPAGTAETAAVLKTCHAHNVGVVPHGGRTGLVGGATSKPGEIILSLERMNSVEDVNTVDRTMTVQAGVILQAAQDAAVDDGLFLALDFGSRGSAFVGGALATNAGGVQVLRYGMAREQVLGLEAVLADGTVLTMMNQMLKNNAGYDLKDLIIGSEGTLAVITRAVLRLRAAPAHTHTALAAVQSLSDAATLLHLGESVLAGGLSSFEAMWPKFYELSADGHSPLETSAPIYLLIEVSGAADSETFETFLSHAFEQSLITDAVIAKSESERRSFWALRENGAPFAKLGQGCAFDVSLPISTMDGFLDDIRRKLGAIGQEEPVALGHLGDGNLHLFAPITEADHAEAVQRIVYDALQPLGGSISAEHGIGLTKKPYLSRSRSESEVAAMRTIKHALDPKGILNPGKVL